MVSSPLRGKAQTTSFLIKAAFRLRPPTFTFFIAKLHRSLGSCATWLRLAPSRQLFAAHRSPDLGLLDSHLLAGQSDASDWRVGVLVRHFVVHISVIPFICLVCGLPPHRWEPLEDGMGLAVRSRVCWLRPNRRASCSKFKFLRREWIIVPVHRNSMNIRCSAPS
ncbi:uncharacterized protein BO88DRAFT_211165 [Aspergillus vadensis CBS 113365]|uniref:Uncharacterized protein n=1 Tax=Aspergillus vadensis (strain CBS 113365 / IMI 142717 / IBT 24658) TaxID=1448311 RepID=A0A319BI64_ASPVC|nr:hypothetical protein BO88DRAFT_211165 [Aspergillus vadensis CBS 113365]PYH72327.1 hypothetical protein BO88DRAFT_211165 [Aspergillus vadensis CBS 113365]